MCLNALIRDERDAVMVPVPQYPLYSASIALYNGTFEGYLLDESNGWSMDPHELQKTVDDAKAAGRAVRGLVFINPGNPTGQCLSKDSLQALIKFCVDNEIVLMADEVYQPNIYQDEKPFISARCAIQGCTSAETGPAALAIGMWPYSQSACRASGRAAQHWHNHLALAVPCGHALHGRRGAHPGHDCRCNAPAFFTCRARVRM